MKKFKLVIIVLVIIIVGVCFLLIWQAQKKAEDLKLDDMNIVDDWSLYQGQNNGKPIFVRVNRWCDNIIGHRLFQNRVGISIPLIKETEDGLLSSRQISAMNDIEDRIIDIVQKNQKTVLAISITGVGFKEFVFYTAEPKMFEVYFKEIEKLDRTLEFQHYIELDRKWSLYKEFVKK